MSERRMTQIMREAQCFGEVFIQTQRARQHAANLRDFQTVG